MKPSRWLGPVALSGALTVGLLSSRSAAPEAVQIGDTPSHNFREPLVNGTGLKSLEDLRGKPVLLDFWGVR